MSVGPSVCFSLSLVFYLVPPFPCHIASLIFVHLSLNFLSLPPFFPPSFVTSLLPSYLPFLPPSFFSSILPSFYFPSHSFMPSYLSIFLLSSLSSSVFPPFLTLLLLLFPAFLPPPPFSLLSFLPPSFSLTFLSLSLLLTSLPLPPYFPLTSLLPFFTPSSLPPFILLLPSSLSPFLVLLSLLLPYLPSSSSFLPSFLYIIHLYMNHIDLLKDRDLYVIFLNAIKKRGKLLPCCLGVNRVYCNEGIVERFWKHQLVVTVALN